MQLVNLADYLEAASTAPEWWAVGKLGPIRP